MINIKWVVLFVSLTGSHLGYGLPVRPTPQTYPHDDQSFSEGWMPEGGVYTAIPALALVFVALAFLFGCTWCYRHKDCKPNEGADNQLFAASASHIHTPQRLQPPDSGFSEPVNNNVSGEDNNNGPISLREMQNIANNNAGGYIFNENEERNANRRTHSRESIVLFDPLPVEIHVDDPLEPYSEWFTSEHFPRNNLQYLREIGRGWFGRVVVGEIENEGATQTIAVKILNQNASLEDKARFLEETRVYRELSHDQILRFLGKCLEEEPWLLLFELCTMDLQRYLVLNRPRMAILNESGVPLQLMSDVSSALAYMHSHGFTYGYLWSGSVLVRGESEEARAVLGRYEVVDPQHDCFAPEVLRHGALYTTNSEIWSLGTLIWEVCSWGSIPTGGRPSPPPELPCPYKNHLYQVMQLCWNLNPEERPTAAQVHALINHLHTTHALVRTHAEDNAHSDLYASSDFEDRWQRLKPNSIPKVDEHIAIVHAPSTSTAHFTESDHGFENTLSVDMDTAVSRSSSIMSDKDPLESQIKSESLTNLHGSLEDVGNIYLTHNETANLECNQGNILEEAREKENDRSDSSVDPWLKEIIAGSQDDVSYYRDVSDVIKNLDNILNSEKTSSSESSHQASPSRDNLSLDCKKDYPVQSSMVKSPGISNFQNFLDTGFASKDDETENENELDRDTIGTLSHSFERHSDSNSQHTLENITPDTPMKDFDIAVEVESQVAAQDSAVEKLIEQSYELPKEIADSTVPKLKELCIVSKPSISEPVKEQLIVKDCETSCDSIRTDNEGTKSLVDVVNTESMPLDEIEITDSVQEQISPEDVQTNIDEIPSKSEETPKVNETETTSENIRTDTDVETETEELKTETDDIRSKSEEQTKVDESQTKSEYVRTEEDEIETGSDDNLTETDEVRTKSEEVKPDDNILPEIIRETNEEIDTLPSVTDEVSNATEASQPNLDSLDEHETTESDNNYSKDETILVSDLIDIVTDSSKDHQENKTESKVEIVIIAQEPTPEIVQTVVYDKNPIESSDKRINSMKNNQAIDSKKDIDGSLNEDQKSVDSMKVKEDSIHVIQEPIDSKKEKVDSTANLASFDTDSKEKGDSMHDERNSIDSKENNDNTMPQNIESTTPTDLPPVLVQNTNNTENLGDNDVNKKIVDFKDDKAMPRSDSDYVVIELNERSNDSTVYMDLINNTNSQILNSTVDNSELSKDNKENKDLETTPTPCDMSTFRNESTVYMDLPSFEILKHTHDFLHTERMSNDQADKIIASTPITSDNSVDTFETLENSTKENETLVLSESKPLDYGPGVAFTKLEQRSVPESMSPFDSPTKSHHTDTIDENSSVVLGPFENCSLELFKAARSTVEMVEIPREEILAFSSNFSEINLETPSPLRDVNFLNEVPDIMVDDNVFDDLGSITEPKDEPPSDTDGSGPSGTEKRVSPSTPPNSPGVFASSEPKYVVDIDLNEPTPEPDSNSLRDEIELNQIELQITSKMAIAENENNLNIEYSGPLTVEGLIEEGGIMRENDEIPETYLAGNGEALEDLRDNLSLDEECVKALRNELELKLPLAQVASIEPQLEGEGEWSSELPPPPELVVSYPGALSPIQEETGHQLSAYENDMQWNPSTRTDSSESYPEPCNNSTDDATELPTGNQEHTYTMPSRDNSHSQNTYTVCKEPAASSRDLTMSADSLNASPLKIKEPTLSPVDDRTYNKEDEKESNCERISQVSPFLVSPTTDTSAPDTSDNTRVSTSKTTLPTDAKHFKPETQCLSKATSIDSWCSNDTLYNVEENFDDLALDPDCAEPDNEGNSDSTDTLTHNEDAQELSHCSTYIVHDSKSENCETFSPDSITANDNHTYTKVKTEVMTAPSVSNVNDSKTTTKDLAYGTLMSGVPSFSNCTTEVASGLEEAWKLPQPELVRKSPIGDINLSPAKQPEENDCDDESSPKITEHGLKKMDSVEITCLQDNLTDTTNQVMIVMNDSPNCNYRNMTPSLTSTPLLEYTVNDESSEAIPMQLPQGTDSYVSSASFIAFQQLADARPQDLSTSADVLLEGETKSLSGITLMSDRTPNYSDFESSALTKPQDFKSSENSVNSEEFMRFENSVIYCPQDLTSLIGSSSLWLSSERMSSELAAASISQISNLSQPNIAHDQTSQSNNINNQTNQSDIVQDHISQVDIINNETSLAENVHNETSQPNITIEETTQPDMIQEETSQSDIVQDHTSEPDIISIQTSQSENVQDETSQPEIAEDQNSQSDIIENHISLPDIINNQTSLSDSQSYIVQEETRQSNIVQDHVSQSDIINNQTSQSDSQSYIVQEETRQSNIVQDHDSQSDIINNQTSLSDSQSDSQSYIVQEETRQSNIDQDQVSQSDIINNQTSQSDSQSYIVQDQVSQSDIINNQSENLHDESSQPNIVQDQTSESDNFDNQTSQSKNLSESTQSLLISPPTIPNLIESHDLVDIGETSLLINFGPEDETEQPHSIIVTEVPMNASKISPNRTYDSHTESHFNNTYDSHSGKVTSDENEELKVNGKDHIEIEHFNSIEHSPKSDTVNSEKVPSKSTDSLLVEKVPPKNTDSITDSRDLLNGSLNNIEPIENTAEVSNEVTKAKNEKLNGSGVNIATVNFLNETFEELIESNVDDGDNKDDIEDLKSETSTNIASPIENKSTETKLSESLSEEVDSNRETEDKVVTEDFLQNEKKFCQIDSYLPLLSDIRFTGPATEIMSTSFSQDSPTEPTSPECEQDSKPNTAAEILKEWDSDSDSHSSNSSSGEFIWKDGDGHETAVVPTTHFDHQRGSNGAPPSDNAGQGSAGQCSEHGSEASGDSCSGSEGDEVEFVPSSWDCRAAPSKSSLRSLEQASLEAGEKKRVVFKRQKYHCVYEYPREALDAEPNSPAYLPDLSTYSEWDPTSVEEAELCYGHLFSMPSYPLRAGIAIGSDYDEDFFISSSARPFESLGVMSTTSQFFPGMHLKPMLERELPEDIDDFPPPPSPLPSTTMVQRTPSLDFTTPDSGVEDITPGSTDEEFKKKLPESELTWRPVDSASSSESVSPSSPGGEALGGLRHTRDKLKLDLPPSPHVPSPRHNRVFNFVLEKPKRRDERTEIETPLVMTDETPIVTALPLPKEDEPVPTLEPTFSTFGKSVQKVEPEQKIILAEVEQTEVKEESPKVVEPVKGEGTVLDSGDEDSGIESSSKATLERKTNVS